ncbi:MULTISPECIES: DoxX family protein [Kordiimonas]|uniref:DoxX family protein n=1 Tax=Kordiimonas TaxID=288021 RepID=UPI002580392A|nr:DoxX family protein [Kordiimonas sp. UBA4487]
MKNLSEQYHALFDRLGRAFLLQDYMLLFVRAWAAKIFYLSGRSKAGDAYLTPSDLTVMLFADEYDLPLIDPEMAAQLALYAETFLPIMLLVGLGARFGALGLIGMTLVIQFLVYPGYFPEHATWIAALLPVVMLGAGRISLDHLLVSRSGK